MDLLRGKRLTQAKDVAEGFSEMFKYEINNTKCIFTDGSVTAKLPNSGFALITFEGEHSMKFQFAGNVSSFCVETLAILEAIKLSEEKLWSNVSIFSDSRSVLSAISANFNCSTGSYLILKIKSLLLECKRESLKISLIWIPSHCGIGGNEMVDSLAKDAAFNGRVCKTGVPLGEIKNKRKANIIPDTLEWCRQEARYRGSYYVGRFLSDSRFSWFEKFNIRRRTISSINRLRSGHSSLRASLFRFLIVDSPDCLTCGGEETPEHVFWECPTYESQREIFIADICKARGFGPHPIEYLLATLDSSIIFSIEKFICSIPLFI